MPVATEQTGEFPSTSFVMENVSEVLTNDTPSFRERREVPAGVYSVQVCNVHPREYFDKPDCFNEDPDSPMPDAIVKRLIPLEIIDGEFANERILLAVYMEPDREKYTDETRYNTHRTKYKMGCERLAKLAQACGLNSVADLDDCAGKFVKATFKGNNYGGKTYLNLVSAEKYGIAKPIAPFKQEPKQEPKPEPATIQESEQITVEKDILF
jgi:hypothetical protein